MDTVADGWPVDETSAGAEPTAPAFHVELTPVATAVPLFHALHGAVPAAGVPHLPSRIEEVLVHPLPKH
jgi:hypothetical protein